MLFKSSKSTKGIRITVLCADHIHQNTLSGHHVLCTFNESEHLFFSKVSSTMVYVSIIIVFFSYIYRGVNDGFKVNTQTHLLPVLATSIKVMVHCICLMLVYFCSVILCFKIECDCKLWEQFILSTLTTPCLFSVLLSSSIRILFFLKKHLMQEGLFVIWTNSFSPRFALVIC